MPIPIIIAILIVLFTLGAKMNQPRGSAARVVKAGGEQYYQIDKIDNRDTLVLMAPLKNDRSISSEQQETATFDNIFQLAGLYQLIKTGSMTAINNSINSNIKQAVSLSEKE